ncbi:MAG: GGDEF domain-containing protein, partial [Frankiales bacterium]|nr:GGDEF domain-containing protein [Frankiales bacterium]
MHSLGGRRPRLTLPDATSPLGLWLRFAVASLVTTSISLVVIRPAWEDLGLLALLLAATGAAVVVGTPRLARWPRVAALAPPVLSFVALGLTGPLTDRLAPAISGLFTLLFVYVGVTQKRGTATWLLPLAAGCWLLANMPVDRATVARLPVAIGIWGIIGELLASITSRNAADQAVLEQRAAYDALTGLHNRHDLDERLADLGPGDAVVFIDLDHFKTVNDTFG